MLEGLEVTIFKLTELRLDNFTYRFDSEYLKKEYLRNITILKKFLCGYSKLKDHILYLSGGATPLGAEYSMGGIMFLRVQNIMQNFFNLEDVVYITKKQNQEIKRSQLRNNDVLLTITGVSYGKSTTVTKDLEGANINQHSVKITLKGNLNPYFLSTFLNSKFGKLQSDKNIVGITRPALDYQAIKNLIIPKVSKSFQHQIEHVIKKAENIILLANKSYTSAETLLLETLDLSNFIPSNEKFNIKSFKESFGTTGRLDAEYYQKKYEQIITHINKGSFAKLRSLVNIKKSIEPGSNVYTENSKGLPFLRVSDYNKFGITIPQKKLKTSFVLSNQQQLSILKPKKNTVLFSKDGSVGKAYCLHEDANFITSGAILQLIIREPQQLLSDYLTLVLNSRLVKMQAERDAGGSIILHWQVNEIKNVMIPLVDTDIQLKIANLIQDSFKLKAESIRLLDIAKQAVEIAIEQDENTAMQFLQNK